MKKVTISLNSPNINNDLLKLRDELLEQLEKSKRQYSQMLKDDPHKNEIISWLKGTGVNSNWGMWFIRNYKKNPRIWGDADLKSKFEHYSGMTYIKEIEDLRFEKEHDLETGLKMLSDAEKTGLEYAVEDMTRHVAPKGEQLIDLGDGWGWYDLGVGSCNEEGVAMRHCGNVPSEKEGDRVLSLRKEIDIEGEKRLVPHLTFIENNGFLGETKGVSNAKPAKKYYATIAKLLEHDRIKGNIGGGYEGEKNFSVKEFKELFPEKYKDLIDDKPMLGIDHYGDLEDSHKDYIFDNIDDIPGKGVNLAESATDPKLLDKLFETRKAPLVRSVLFNAKTSTETLDKFVNSFIEQGLDGVVDKHTISGIYDFVEDPFEEGVELLTDLDGEFREEETLFSDFRDNIFTKASYNHNMSTESLDKLVKYAVNNSIKIIFLEILT
jgi:hypothetical protein